MSKKEMTLMYYYVPEDNDDPEIPNVFGIMVSKNQIRLQHIYDAFPLKGSYIFRFKVMYDNTIAWLDLPDLDTKLPTFKERIIVKATRISWEPNHENPYGHYRFVKQEKENKQNTTKKAQNISSSSAKQPQATTNLLDEKIETPPPQANGTNSFDLI